MPLTVQLLYNLAFKKEHIFRTGFEYGKIISRVDPIRCTHTVYVWTSIRNWCENDTGLCGKRTGERAYIEEGGGRKR